MTRGERGLALCMRDVRRVHGSGETAVHALNGISMEIPYGSFTALMGPSGSGKSTFLQCAAGLDRPSGGDVLVGGTNLSRLSERRRTRLRRDRIGVAFQAYSLLPALTVQDNITLPLRLAGRRVDHDWAQEIIARIGLHGLLHRRPGELSGGQQQRVAIARALLGRPSLILADEPTGALDSTAAARVLGLLREIVDELGQTVLMVTHDPVAAARCDRLLLLADGSIVEEMRTPDVEQIAGRMAMLGAAR